jgi:small subunit ribosomal protein S1
VKQLTEGGPAAGAASGGDAGGAATGGLKKNAVVTVEVTKIEDSGIEVKLVEGGQTSYIRRADLARDRNDQRPDRFSVGQKVDARVTSADKKSGKVGLSIKALEVAQEKEAIAQYGSTDSGASLGDILGAALKQRDDKDD